MELWCSGSGLGNPRDILRPLLEGWDHATLCIKNTRSTVFIGDFEGNGNHYCAVPRTTWRYDTHEMSAFDMDVDPSKFAGFFAGLLGDMV